VLQHLRARRDDVELLARVFADARELTTASADFLFGRNVVLNPDARQRRVDRLALATLACMSGNFDVVCLRLAVRLLAEYFRLIEDDPAP
jgi:hypothetical protein